jgi:hypothetical protein
MRSGIGGVLFLVLALLFGLVAGSQAAEKEARAALEAKKAALFKEMLLHPTNLDLTFAYAKIAAELGDYEGAVSALERMLLFNPNLPRVDLELGALYFRMGSFALSRSYFEKTLAAHPPPEIVARIKTYLAAIEKALSRHRWSGTLLFGMQYQSDANVAPGSPLIQSPIGTILLAPQFVKQPDHNIFWNGSFLYSYDLLTQNRDTIEVTGNGFMNHYFIFNNLDLDFGEVTAGPRLRFPQLEGAYRASFRPYVILNEVALGENQYFYTYGSGLEYEETVWKDLFLRSYFEIRQQTFTNAPDRPLSTGFSGPVAIVSLYAAKPVTTNSQLSLEFDYFNQAAHLPFYANDTYGVAGSYHVTYPNPLKITRYPFETTFFLARTWSLYEGPDPCCNTSGTATFSPSTRFDRRWRFGLTHALIFSPRMALIIQLERDIVSSNLPLYRYTSDSFLIGPEILF